MAVDADRLSSALRVAVARLREEMRPEGYWEGKLSSSALATATAVVALRVNGRPEHAGLVRSGAAWLAGDQNADGGWGDSPESPSNLPTTMLAVAALTLDADDASAPVLTRADDYISARAGRSIDERVAAIARLYGKDRTFAVPILLTSAVAGLTPWGRIPPLPFELAVLPHALYKAVRLQVVSYALPALIAVGLALHRRNPAGNVIARKLRDLTTGRALRKLEAIQPASGGFLEAVPLTSFVAMSLAEASLPYHPVTNRCLDFIAGAARPDGSWPIDSDLSVWLTSNAALALDAAGALSDIDGRRTRDWLIGRQHRARHAYTDATPGGWAWTHRPGGVPDADDTARAVSALGRLGEPPGPAVAGGVRWLLDLQNSDGGWPTFCRGWGKLPFDRSSPDLTAHALQALRSCDDRRVRAALVRGIDYLRQVQRPDGSWAPLWFGNQLAPGNLNLVLGTAAVLPALLEADEHAATERGTTYLLDAQDASGGWGGAKGVRPSIEETACAVAALARVPNGREAASAVERGTAWLIRQIEDGAWTVPAPIGLYFSSLWYSERLYPMIWIVEALGRVAARRTCTDG